MSPSIPAYLDPASGSIAWQVAISSILAVAAACRLYWQKLKSLFRRGDGDTVSTLRGEGDRDA
jgi:hypothetical protein